MSDHITKNTNATDSIDTNHPDPTDSKPIDPSDFDFSGLGLPQNFQQMLRSRPVLSHIPLRKPYKTEWFRCHPEWEREAVTLKLDGDRKDDLYIVHQDLVPAVPGNLITAMVFVPTITRQGTLMFWPIRIPQSDAKHEKWARTAGQVARLGRTRWVQLVANLGVGAYDHRELLDHVGEPEWPDLTWPAMQALAFREWYITTLDHPILLEVVHGK